MYFRNNKISFSKLRSYVALFMIYCTAIDMGGGLYIKYISYVIGTLCLFFTGFKVTKNTYFELLFCLLCIAPIMSLLIGILNNGDIALGVSNITSFIPCVLFLFLIDDTNIKIIIKGFLNSIFFISILTIIVYVIFIIFPSYIIPISEFLDSREIGMFGLKAIEQSSLPGVYFKISLFYNFAFIIYLYNKNFLKACIVLIAIILSFSKSSLFIAGIILIFYPISTVKSYNGKFILSKQKIIFLLLIPLLVLCLILLSQDKISDLYTYYYESLIGKSDTVNVRVEHFKSLILLFKEHPIYLIFGQGAGTEFYTSGFNEYVNNIEIDHFNTIRKFGILWSGIFFFFNLFIPLNLMCKCSILKYIGIAYILTFILVGTNPLLISPFFLMLFVSIYKLNYHCNKFII